MDKNKVGTMMQSAAKVPISELNECITCKLCKGYFIEATTIIECLHTFCRSCIVRYLESNRYCPICDVQVHKTKPLLNLRPDKTIQNLVYKLVPRLYQNERQRKKTFYESHPEGVPTAAEQAAESMYDYILAPEESINLMLHYYGCDAAPRYLRCPSAVLVTHLKKLIRAKYGLTEHHRVDVFFNQDCLNPSFSLMDISYIYSWKRKDPLDLTYKIYESRAKRPKLDTTDNSDNNANNSANNNNNNNWKEVQLRISETGEMSITGIEDASMLELLDATENFKSEIVINEGKNLENFPKPVQVDTDIGNSEVKIQANNSVSIGTHVKAPDNAPNSTRRQENAQKNAENNLKTPKKDLPGLKCIGKSSASTNTTSSVTNTSSSCLGAKIGNNSTKTVNSNSKTGNTISKMVNSSSKTSVENKKAPSKATNHTEASKTSSTATNVKTSMTKSSKASTDIKQPKNSMSMPKSMELSATLNLNSELSVIPLSASTSCVSLNTCDGTTTVFSTINNSMCSTKMECGDGHGCTDKVDKDQVAVVNSKEGHTDRGLEPMLNNIPKDSKNLKRKCEEDGKAHEIPTKLPKPTILNHSIGLMNLSNNHPLKKHSKINRNGEHLLRSTELGEKVPISTPTLTVNHVSVPQRHISMDTTPSKPIIINKNVSNLQINRPGTPKSIQRGGQGGNVSCYANKSMYNLVGSLGKLGERNGEKLEGMQAKPEVLNSTVNSIAKTTHHPVNHTPSYQTTQNTPIITPAQLSHHQNLNSLHVKPPNLTLNQENTEQKGFQGNVPTSHSNVATSQVSTSQSNVTMVQGSITTSQISFKTSIVASVPSNVSSQKHNDATDEAYPLSNRSPMQTTPLSTSNHSMHANALSSTPTADQNTPTSQAQLVTVSTPVSHAPAAIKTKPSTPIGYKTLRDPPKSWNSQINSQIARVNQNVKAQQLANAAAAASQGGGVNAQGRYSVDLKSVRPAKFFKGRNMPRYLGCPASGVKPMYQVQASSDKEKTLEQQTVPLKAEKSEIKKHSIVKIDPKTLRPISEKAPETSNLSNMSSNLGLNASQSNQELRVNSTAGDLKINTSSVSIFNPLKLQSSPKSERKSPKSPHSPKVKGSPNGNNLSAATTIPNTSSPSSNTLSPKQHRDKTNLTFTPPNPFVPNLSPTMSPNQFLYPAGGFPSYDPRVMAAYHSLWYTQRMAAAAAAGFVPPPMPHAFGMNIGLNTVTTTMGQQQHNSGISPKHSTPPKPSGQPSPRGTNTTPTQISKTATTPKKTKETTPKSEKSLQMALNKLSQNKAKELGENKQVGNNKQQLGASKKTGASKELGCESIMPVDAQRSATPKVLVASKPLIGLNNSVGNAQPRISSTKSLGGNTETFSGNNEGTNLALVGPQQNRGSPKTHNRSNSAMSALEKLSHNKAIEIVRERDGGNSAAGEAKSVLGTARLVDEQDVPFKGSSTPPVTKKPSVLATEQKDKTASPENKTAISTSCRDPKESSQLQHMINSNIPTSVYTPSEQKTESFELQSRLEQSSATHRLDKCEKEVDLGQNMLNKGSNSLEQQERSEQGQNRLDQVQNKLDQVQNRLEQGQNRLDQVQNTSDQVQNTSDQVQIKSDQGQDTLEQVLGCLETSQGALIEKKSTNMQESASSSDHDSSTDPKVAPSDTTDKTETNNDKKQSILDSSDIKHSSSHNSIDIRQNSSAKDIVSPSDSCDNSVTDNSTGNIATQASGGVGSGESDVVVVATLGNNAVSNVKDAVAGNSENKSDSVAESDRGGGEK